MLITTGILLGLVLLVMVGEQAQEMQLAHWISRTEINWLGNTIPPWVGMWFAVFPTYETMTAQFLAALLVVGSYFAARSWRATPSEEAAALVRAKAQAKHAIVGPMETVPASIPRG